MALFSEKTNGASKLPTPDIVCQWKEEDVLCWLQEVNLSECAEAFKNRKIDGEELLALNEEKLWLWAGDLKIRQRIQITKYLNDCRSRDPDSPSFKASLMSKIRNSPVPPPVPRPDYTAGSVTEDDSFDDVDVDAGWDTDFDEDSEDEAETGVEQPYVNYEKNDTVMNGARNGSPTCNGNGQVSKMVKKLGSQCVSVLPQRSTTTQQHGDEQITNSSESSPNVNNTSKPEVTKPKPMPRPPVSVVIPNNVKPTRPSSIVSRPVQLPPPPPTAPKPKIYLDTSPPVPIAYHQTNNSNRESPPIDSDTCDNYEVPTSSNISDRSISSLEPHVAASTISLLSAGSSSQGNEDLLSPSQLELNRGFMDENVYELTDVESQWSGSSGVSVRSTSSDRPVLPPKFRPLDVCNPPPLPEKPNRRHIEPPMLPARDKPGFIKKPAEDPPKSRKTNGCKPLFSIFPSRVKKANSTSGVDKVSPERESIPTTTAAMNMTRYPSLSSLRPTNTDAAALVNARPLPPVPVSGIKQPEVLPLNESFQGSISRLSSTSSFGNDLDMYPWFYKVERDEAEKLLKTASQSGMYLVRESRRAGECNPFTLTIYFDGKISHLNIRKRSDGKFALGKEKELEKTFSSVEDLVLFHQSKPISLSAKGQPIGETRLLHCPKIRGR